MRMIEQLINVLAKILLNKESKNYKEAIDNIEGAFNSILGVDYNLINVLSDKDIISLLGISGENSAVKYIITAKLLKEKADIKSLINKEDLSSISDYKKALGLYLEGILNINNTEIDMSSYNSDVRDLALKLKDEIPDDLRFKLLKFYELTGG